jgi:hypothetical protein
MEKVLNGEQFHVASDVLNGPKLDKVLWEQWRVFSGPDSSSSCSAYAVGISQWWVSGHYRPAREQILHTCAVAWSDDWGRGRTVLQARRRYYTKLGTRRHWKNWLNTRIVGKYDGLFYRIATGPLRSLHLVVSQRLLQCPMVNGCLIDRTPSFLNKIRMPIVFSKDKLFKV